MYRWRSLSEKERQAELQDRKRTNLPWHHPPHRQSDRTDNYLITATCYEHRPHIGSSEERMREFSTTLANTIGENSERLFAWCVLPNHYHALVRTPDVKKLLSALGKMHGRLSHAWNGADGTRGRTVWHGAVERAMRSDRHFFATLNYVHHNPVKHGYVERWQDWEFSSVHEYLAEVGRETALETWREYPLGEYGNKWDIY